MPVYRGSVFIRERGARTQEADVTVLWTGTLLWSVQFSEGHDSSYGMVWHVSYVLTSDHSEECGEVLLGGGSDGNVGADSASVGAQVARSLCRNRQAV